MNIEEKIFRKSKVDFEKLIPYGFQKADKDYIYSKNIINDSFRIDITISAAGKIIGKIFDLSFGEEYTNYRIKNQSGEFVGQVRSEFEEILNDIKEHCAVPENFITGQANRIADLIDERYGDAPDFTWEKFPGYGIFRNPRNEKWYALIMNISRSKLEQSGGKSGNADEDLKQADMESSQAEEVEIINVKLDDKKIPGILKKKGIYPAYHMNKDNWVSIILDDTLGDDEIFLHIEQSHGFTEKVNEWIIPANPKYYDIEAGFRESKDGTLTWKQSNNICVDDIVYIYVAAPVSAIKYKCKAIEVDLPYQYADENVQMKKIMRLQLLERYDKVKLDFAMLKAYGVRAVRGPRSMPESLRLRIEELQPSN